MNTNPTLFTLFKEKSTMKTTTKTLLTALTATAAIAAADTSSAATISVLASDFATGNATGVTLNYTPSAAGNILVVGGYNDQNDHLVYTLDSNAPIDSIVDDRVSMAYFETTGTSEITLFGIGSSTTGTRIGLFVYELSGVDLSGGVVKSAGESITTTADDTFVISLAGANGGVTVTENSALLSTTSPPDFDSQIVVDGNGGTISTATGTAATAGLYSTAWTGDGEGVVNLGFVAVPEPGSLALLAAGGLMMIKRRRRDA